MAEHTQVHPAAMEYEIVEEHYCTVNNVRIYYEYANIDQATSQTTSQSTFQSTSQSTFQSTSQSTDQPPDHDTDQATNQQTALVFLHGWTANRYRLHPLYILYQQANWPVFRLDLRGHGWSQKQGVSDFRLTTMKTDLDAFIRTVVLEKFHFKRVIIIAHSMGGSISQLLALDHPSYLQAMVLLASSCEWADSIVEKLKWMLYTAYYWLFHDKMYWKKKDSHIPWGLEHFPMWHAAYLPPNKDLFTKKKATIQGLRELHRLHICEKISRIQIPVLILAGENDTAAPVRYSERMHARFPHSTFQILSEVNHDIAIGKPLTAKKNIDAFLDQIHSNK